MTKLSVNINKIATLRNARGGNVPNVLQVAIDCIRFGAEGITVHPRPDERHIKKTDVFELAKAVTVEFNIEGYPSEDFLALIEKIRPAQCTLVPDPPHVLTSNAGWNTMKHKSFLQEVTGRLREWKVRSSIFIEADAKMIESAAETGTDRIELYTESYAKLFPANPEAAVAPFREAAKVAAGCKLGLNAGHDLDLHNLKFLKENMPNLLEVSIGHALIADALYLGLEETVRRYKAALG